MKFENRTMTLAAQLFRETPELRAAAKRTPLFDQVTTRGRRLSLDGRDYYLLEGDLLYDEDELQLYVLQEAPGAGGAPMGATATQPLPSSPALVGISNGQRLVRWAPGQILSYAVLRTSFPDEQQYALARDSVQAAAQAWEGVCGVEFEHREALDAHEDPSDSPHEIDPDLVFTVRHIDAGGQFIASAFFPTYPPARRRVLIDPSFFAPDLGFDPVGVLRHELGHVLGFRHEHIRSGAPAACPGEDTFDAVDLTAYDPQSVMHYFCGGVGSRDLKITELDRQGAQTLYGPPVRQLTFVA